MIKRAGLPLLALLPGCIPHQERLAPAPIEAPPPRDDGPSSRSSDAEAVRRANQRSLEEAGADAQPPPRRARQDDDASPSQRGPTFAPVTARPAWEARPVTPDAETLPPSRATARAGDTLVRLAQRSGVSAGAIAAANGLTLDAPLRPGQQLDIPGGRYHRVRAGEAGIAIARAYGVPWAEIIAANALAEPFTIHVGERILIPGTALRGTDIAERAAAFTLDVDDILTGGEPALAVNQAPSSPTTTARRVLPPSAQVSAPVRLVGGFAWPVEGRLVARFGPGRSGERNDGVAIAAPLRTPVRAAADGVVVYAGTGVAVLGGIVIIRHGEGWTTVYGHASKLLVQRGQSVKRGQTIALSGDTGNAEQPDVHFELRRGRTPVDPATRLPPLQGA